MLRKQHLGPPEESRLGQPANQPRPRRWEGEISQKGALDTFHETPVRVGQDRAFVMLPSCSPQFWDITKELLFQYPCTLGVDDSGGNG